MIPIRDPKTEIRAHLDQVRKTLLRVAMELYEDHPAQEMLAWSQDHLTQAEDDLVLLNECACSWGDS